MAGTGSHDVVVDDVFVPAERCVSMTEMSNGVAPGSRLHEGPLYRTPMAPILILAAATAALGRARVSVGRFRERLQQRVMFGGVKQLDKAAAHIRLARADVEVREAEFLMRQTVNDVCARRNQATMQERGRWAAQLAIAVDRCKHVIRNICEASGGGVHLLSNPLQRTLRDVETLSCHLVFDLDSRLETYGRVMLGLEPGIAPL